jgi:hypothetical protein
MIRAIFWKEWRENRWKYLAYWLVLNLPMLVVLLSLSLSKGAWAPFADLSDGNVLKYLPLALIVVAALAASVFAFATAFLAVATFTPELEGHSLFFLYEQPVSRYRYIGVKLLTGATQVVLAVTCAILFAPAALYGMMLLGGKVTAAGSSAAFQAVMWAALRGAVWVSLISLMVFAAAALLSALTSRWWLATAGSFILVAMLIGWGDNFFDFFGAASGEPLSVGFSIGSQWVTVSRSMGAELARFGGWRTLPLLTAAAATALFSAATAALCARKELQ